MMANYFKFVGVSFEMNARKAEAKFVLV